MNVVVGKDESGSDIIEQHPIMDTRHVLFKQKVSKRKHLGFTSQQVKSALAGLGASAGDYALYIKTDPDDPESEEGLRYDHFITPLVKAVQELSTMVAAQAERIEALEKRS
jgi:hypothetical protein